MQAMGSCLTNKYAEGYPGKRYYGGCQVVDEVENLAIERIKKLFGAEYANVQPHSGAQANAAVLLAVLKPGDVFMGLNLAHGGHLSHGSAVNTSGILYHAIGYDLDKETGRVNYDQMEQLAIENKPKLIIGGGSAYSREWDYKRMREIADKVGALLMIDMAHPAGLIAAGLLDNPVKYAHIVTSTTHKTLRGPRGGIILMGKDFENHRSLLKSFYSVLKTQDRYIRFAFITGVTKFGKVSVFSDLNNLMDISMDQRYISICGMTQDELLYNFREGIEQLGEAYGDTEEETLNKLKIRYDGYHFEEDTVGIYNPFSVLNTLAKLRYKDYWFETGTPTFLVELLKLHHYELENLTKEQISADVINSVDSMSTNPIPVIYQSGYLTIKGYDERLKKYRLGFPNKEVEEGFLNFLLPFYSTAGSKSPYFIEEFVKDVKAGNIRLPAMFI